MQCTDVYPLRAHIRCALKNKRMWYISVQFSLSLGSLSKIQLIFFPSVRHLYYIFHKLPTFQVYTLHIYKIFTATCPHYTEILFQSTLEKIFKNTIISPSILLRFKRTAYAKSSSGAELFNDGVLDYASGIEYERLVTKSQCHIYTQI